MSDRLVTVDLSLIGRHKDLFISGGENVYPAEIENALAGHPQVADCALVARPDARWGEVGHLFVVPERGASAETTVSTESYNLKNYELQLMREIRLTQEQRERNQQYMYPRLFWAVTSTMLLVGLIYEISGKGFL